MGDMEENAVKSLCDRLIIYAENAYIQECAHFHDGYEITFFVWSAGGIVHNIENRSYTAKSGSIVIVNENEIHHALIPDKTKRYHIHFKPEIIRDIVLLYPVLVKMFADRPENFENCILLGDSQKEHFIGLLHKMLCCYESSETKSREAKVVFGLCEILLAINDIYSANDNSLAVMSNVYQELLSGIMSHIRNNLNDDLSLDALVKKFYTSKTHMNKIFKRYLNITPGQYVIYCRIMKSREYLRRGVSVEQTCRLVGYSNLSEFICTFKKFMNCTPKKYQMKEP